MLGDMPPLGHPLPGLLQLTRSTAGSCPLLSTAATAPAPHTVPRLGLSSAGGAAGYPSTSPLNTSGHWSKQLEVRASPGPGWEQMGNTQPWGSGRSLGLGQTAERPTPGENKVPKDSEKGHSCARVTLSPSS